MDHVFYSDGDAEGISWAIQTGESLRKQSREHAQVYRGRVSVLQSKYIALHVGLFWGIGVFALRDGDGIRIMLDEAAMREQLASGAPADDPLIGERVRFIRHLISQRGFGVEYELIGRGENLCRMGRKS